MKNGRFVIAGWALGVLMAVTGCGAKDQGASEAQPAALPGAATTEARSALAAAGAAGVSPQKTASQPDADSAYPHVVIETELGNIVVKLDAKKAPLTVAHFLAYVDARHYDGTIFHQVFKNYVIVGGGYTPQLAEKPTSSSVRNEADNGLRNARGTIAMARQPDVIDSARAQFFINLDNNSSLDHQDRSPEGYGYCAFGEVVKGMEIVDRIANVPVKDIEDFESFPTDAVLIKSVRRGQ